MSKQHGRQVVAQMRGGICRGYHFQRLLCNFRGVIKRKRMLILALTAFFVVNLFLWSSIVGQLMSGVTLQSHGVIETVGVAAYSNSACNESVSVFSWGEIFPGSISTNTIYLKNEGSTDIILSLHTANWVPSTAQYYMTLTWDYLGQTISPDEVIEITLTLSVNSAIEEIENFNFDIGIVGIATS